MEVRGLVAQNIVLAGGNCMVPGFATRLLQEVRHMVTTLPEFADLAVHADKLAIPDCIFAPNIMNWVGASLMMSLGRDVDKFLLTAEQYANEQIPDRFADAFLVFNRKGNYFNKTFEVNLKQQRAQEMMVSPNVSESHLDT